MALCTYGLLRQVEGIVVLSHMYALGLPMPGIDRTDDRPAGVRMTVDSGCEVVMAYMYM